MFNKIRSWRSILRSLSVNQDSYREIMSKMADKTDNVDDDLLYEATIASDVVTVVPSRHQCTSHLPITNTEVITVKLRGWTLSLYLIIVIHCLSCYVFTLIMLHNRVPRGFRYSYITGSAIALYCCKAHSKINGKIENSSPCKIVTPKNFIMKLGTMIMSRTSPTTQVFVYIALVRESPQIGEI